MEDTQWTEEVEDLVDAGETEKAISVLERTVSGLQERDKHSLQLAAALMDLSTLYSSRGLSLKADLASSTARTIRQHSDKPPLDDDWEAVADCGPEELLTPQVLPEISELSMEDRGAKSSKRRGRGTFSYKAQGLYSDQQSDGPIYDEPEESSVSHTSEENSQIRNFEYGTRHVLVLDGFPPSTKTIDLEKLVAGFKDQGVLIRWISDTVALAVFKSPSIALEASKSIKCPFTVHILEESDELLSSIPPKDLEPPRPRPKTSARTAQRLIAQSMGIKLPSTFGSRELREQEEARKNRIVARQHMRDDAWGDD